MGLSFLHPGFLYAAAAAAAAVVALHFLVAEQPRAGMLPTARFFPDVEVRSTTLAVRLSDILLLLLRVATLLLIGAAFAQPKLKPARSSIVRIVAVDMSRDVASSKEIGDSAGKFIPGAATVIVFDSLAREGSAGDFMRSIAVRGDSSRSRRGSLSAALIVALRAASRVRDQADSLELVLITPLLAEELDSATPAIRALWPGRINVVRVAGARQASEPPSAATLEWADSSTAGVWSRKANPDTIGGLSFDSGVVVYPFVRKWSAARADSVSRVVARWVDGEPAIVERRTKSGCVRSAALSLPSAGDAILRTSFVRLVASLHAPCATVQSFATLVNAEAAMIVGPAHLAPASAIRPESSRMTPLVAWLLAAALLLALFELFLRRSGERSHDSRDDFAAAEVAGERQVGRVA